MSLLLRYYSLNRLQLFIGIVLANLIIIWLSGAVLINEIVFYNTFSEQLTYDRSLKLFEDLKRISWISYAFTPIMLLIKFSLISLVLYIGIVFLNIQDKVSLGSVFKIVIASEIIFVCASLLKFLWFYLFAGNYDLNDLGFFYPLSLINFFKTAEVSRLWIFPLQTVNLFQIIYIISISYGLNKVCKIEKPDSDKVVLLSYLPALVLWVALIMFLSIDASL
ncbi:MAG: hypothetical protein Q8N38_06745 [Bacteroidales bacterium]|nr:hypothetical protein [Bacteroidales bacterium]